MKRYLKIAATVMALTAALAIGCTFGASYYYTTRYGQGCANCHEMAVVVNEVHSSPHRKMGCMSCHEASLATKLRHTMVHIFGPVPGDHPAARHRCSGDDADLQELPPA